MIPKILFGLITTILANLFIILYKNDNPADFLPIVHSLENGSGISAYDTFLIIAIIQYKILFSRFGITLQSIKQTFSIFNHPRILDLIFCALAAVAAYVVIWPILCAIFWELLTVIAHSHPSIRKAVLVQIPILWIFLTTITQSRISSYQQQNAPAYIPPPPQWP